MVRDESSPMVLVERGEPALAVLAAACHKSSTHPIW
jgi:hypothetical protein